MYIWKLYLIPLRFDTLKGHRLNQPFAQMNNNFQKGRVEIKLIYNYSFFLTIKDFYSLFKAPLISSSKELSELL